MDNKDSKRIWNNEEGLQRPSSGPGSGTGSGSYTGKKFKPNEPNKSVKFKI